MTNLSDELRTIADTIETNGGWHIAAVKVRAAAEEIEGAHHDIDRLMAACTAEANEVQRLRAARQRLRAWALENGKVDVLDLIDTDGNQTMFSSASPSEPRAVDPNGPPHELRPLLENAVRALDIGVAISPGSYVHDELKLLLSPGTSRDASLLKHAKGCGCPTCADGITRSDIEQGASRDASSPLEHPFRVNCTCPSEDKINPNCQIGFPHPWHRSKRTGAVE